jgi:hypothetical protein
MHVRDITWSTRAADAVSCSVFEKRQDMRYNNEEDVPRYMLKYVRLMSTENA